MAANTGDIIYKAVSIKKPFKNGDETKPGLWEYCFQQLHNLTMCVRRKVSQILDSALQTSNRAGKQNEERSVLRRIPDQSLL